MRIDKINWLVGILEGEGSLCMCKGHRNRNGWDLRHFNITIAITNTDLLILSECKIIIDGITGGNCKIRDKADKKNKGKKCFNLVVEGFAILTILLKRITPYIIGEKKAQAELILQFLKRRELVKGNKKKSPKYTEEDLKYLEAMSALKQTESVETIRFSTRTVDDIVRAARINKGAELGRNDLTSLFK